MNADLRRLTKALVFAAEAHRNQRRKGAAQEPYLNHLIEVLDLVVQTTDGIETDVLIAAVLHDVVEDTPTSYDDVAKNFGERVAKIVRENSDDMSLPKAERRRARIAGMQLKSKEARLVKMADVISNLRAIAVSPPAGWPTDRKLGYLEGCRQLIDAGRGTDATIERTFDETAADVERTIRDEAPFLIEGREVATRQLENTIGQAVHLIYLPNTENHNLGEAEVDRLCEIIGRSFPSATVQPRRRSMKARDGPFSWRASGPIVQTRLLISPNAYASPFSSDLLESRLADGTSESMTTTPHRPSS